MKIGINFFYVYLMKGGRREIVLFFVCLFGLVWCNDSWKMELDS